MREKNIMEDITIYDILKNAPRGLKLYSPLFGEVEFHDVDSELESITVHVADEDESFHSFNKNGKYFAGYEGAECLLFPNKECRTWDNWQYELFNPGDIVCNEDNDFYLCESWNTFITVTGEKIENTGFLGALEYATKEEVEKFRKELAKNGFSWTSLGLIKIEENHEPKQELIFNPYDRVLVCDSIRGVRSPWVCDLYSGYDKDATFHYVTMGGSHFEQCIPYNEETKELIGTTKEYNKK